MLNKEGLWYRVLKARYREAGRLQEGGRDCSMWWRMVSSIRGGVGVGVGSWFEDNVRRAVGGGGTTHVWTNNWVGGVSLRVCFPRLFYLSKDKGVTVAVMASRGWGVGSGTWVWRRHIFAWEEECIRECCTLLHDIVLQERSINRWDVVTDPSHGYIVKGAYHILTSVEEHPVRGLFDDVWHKNVPLKVVLFAWRLLRNRLPTKDNLVRRRVLHYDANLCVGGCGFQESATHLFLNCAIFGNLWVNVLQWLNISFVAPEVLR